MKKNQGLAVIPLIVIILLVGVAGFSIFSWVKTKSDLTAEKEGAEQRETELKAVLEGAQQEADEFKAKSEELQENLTKTEEAMKLAEEKAQQDAEEKAEMIAELEENLAAEEAAKIEFEEKSAELSEEIAKLEENIEEAQKTERMLRASLGAPMVTINPRAKAGIETISNSLASQKDEISKIKALLSSGEPIAKSDLQALIRSFEEGLIEAEQGAAGLEGDLVKSGEFSSSSNVGQAIADLKQTTLKQRSILNSLKSLVANSGETIDPAQVAAMITDLETSIDELEQRQHSLDDKVSAEASAGGDAGNSAAVAEFQRKIQQNQAKLAAMKRQLAQSEAAKDAAIARQEELEKLSIEIKYDIEYKARSGSYMRRLHSLYDRVANPVQERE